jgi:hypothetical protein
MTVVRGGGTTYQIGSGKEMEWEQVPQWFKAAAKEQEERPPHCDEARVRAQKCIEGKGFWAEECVQLTDQFHQCSSISLRTELRGPPGEPGWRPN